jgi:hypothetical protein
MTVEEKKKLVGLVMGDSLRQLISKSKNMLERMGKDGIESCASANLDLLDDALSCWKNAQSMHILVNLIPNKEETEKNDSQIATK